MESENTISLGKKAAKGASWLALFKLISQFFSWTVTILVARILVPEDYGLFELSMIFTGYAFIFSELGLGAAIIQRTKPTKGDLSSVFWFCMGVSFFLAILCIPISYLTAFIFNETRLISLTQAVAIIFILSGLQIVPLNLLKKELEFKKIGIIEMLSVFGACSSMLFIANMGGGVWTLFSGIIIRSLIQVILIYWTLRWVPKFHYSFNEAKSYLKFGIAVAIARSFFYIFSKSDRFFAGRFWSAKMLGYYSFALELAQLPTEKITVLINQVSFPLLSKFKNEKEKFNRMYLKIVKITMTLVMPIFVGGFFISEEVVNFFLGDKWSPIIFVFKFLCLSQILTSLNAINSFVHNAQGRPRWSVYYFASCAVLMGISFFIAAQHGINAIMIPWFTTYVFLCGAWITITFKKIGITSFQYIKNIMNILVATLIMVIPILGIQLLFSTYLIQWNSHVNLLVLKIIFGGLFYTGYLWLSDKELFYEIKALRS